jgi:putative heme-binding domain-containing protein
MECHFQSWTAFPVITTAFHVIADAFHVFTTRLSVITDAFPVVTTAYPVLTSRQHVSVSSIPLASNATHCLKMTTPVSSSCFRFFAMALLVLHTLVPLLHSAEVTPTPANLNSAPVGNNDPMAELASFKVADGFEVNLFASEKEGIVKPIAHRFDRLGRLWVIGSITYPQIKPGEEPNDYVKILEDTNGDGKADKVTTFAEGLYIPTGIEIDGDARGAWIGEGSKLWHMRDEDGDGKADRKEVVLRGFGTGDNHQNINSFRFSPGGELLMSQGLHAFSRVETPYGVISLKEAGYFRFRPRLHKLTGFWGGHGDPQNPWGFVWDDWGNLFIQAGNNGSLQDALPSAFEGGCGPRPNQIWQDARGRKCSNPDFVGTAHFPPEWQSRLIAPGYINNTVWVLDVKPDGSTFKATDMPPLIKSTHGSFRPMDAKFAPDGSLYIADWYNPIIGHYQASFRHPDRDKNHGRIWRVVAKGRSLVKPAGFLKAGEKAPLDEIIAGLGSEERFVRENARKILGGMDGKVVLPAVLAWEKKSGTDKATFEALAVHEWHEVADFGLLRGAFKSKDAGVRAYACGVAAKWSERVKGTAMRYGTEAGKDSLDTLTAYAELGRLADDDESRVRLAAVIAAANIRSNVAPSMVLRAGGKLTDVVLDFARKEAVARLKPVWEPMIAKPILRAFTPEEIAFLRDPGKPIPVAAKTDAAVTKFVGDALKGVGGTLKATPDFVNALMVEVREKGDAARGALVFKKAELGCVTCHRVGNEGGTLGPDLNNIGSAQPLDFIIGAVLEPTREIKEGFETRLVTTKDGRAVTGYRRAGAADELVLWDAATQRDVKLKLADVADNKPLASLMPAGLVDRLTREELRDLFRYLGGLGK